MILEKIEKTAALSFSKDAKTDTFTYMQACYHNLKHLQKQIETIKHLPEDKISRVYSQASSFCNVSKLTCLSIDPNQTICSVASRPRALKSENSPMHQTFSFNSQSKSKCKNIPMDLTFKQNRLKSERILVPTDTNAKEKHDKKFRVRKNDKKQHITGLKRDQRYFEDKEVELSERIVEKIGLYEAANMFKTKNIAKFIRDKYADKLKPVINLKFSSFPICNRNEFFLTENAQMALNDIESISENSEIKTDTPKKIDQNSQNNETGEEKYFDQIMQEEPGEEATQRDAPIKSLFICKNQWNLTFNNSKVVRDESYLALKINNIEQWSDISHIVTEVEKYLKKRKISHLVIKFDTEQFLRAFWVCKKIDQRELQKLLKIRMKRRNDSSPVEEVKIRRLFNNKAEIMRELVRIWRDRKNLNLRRKEIKNSKQMMNWINMRLVVKCRIKREKQNASQIATLLNKKLLDGHWDYDVQIYLPSFSESEFIRNATQYMEHYENLFYHMWMKSTKQIVLILPAVNEFILSYLQEKTKIVSNITIICPQTHELYPNALPLAACLLYSTVAISKLKKILEGKRGIIVPGRNVSLNTSYEIYLSKVLNCPLFCSLVKPTDIVSQQAILQNYLNIPNYGNIAPGSSLDDLVNTLATLIVNQPKAKIWLLKISGQFNGRGFGRFDVASSKKLTNILKADQMDELRQSKKVADNIREQTRKEVLIYLQTYFRLKLKVNFQNTIFRTDEFIQCFLATGGIVQQLIQEAQTFQLCYRVSGRDTNSDGNSRVRLLSVCQNFSVDFVNRSSLFCQQLPEAIAAQKERVEKMLQEEDYIGYISIILIHEPVSQLVYGIEIKSFMTANCSVGFFINNINNFNKCRPSDSHRKSDIQGDNTMMFLFIPTIIFTDVDEIVRSQLIQSLTVDSWNNLSNQLFSSGLISNGNDFNCGLIYLSMGMTLSLLLYSRSYDLRKMKKSAVEAMRVLSEKVNGLERRMTLQQRRDVFQVSDVIRSITSIKI